MQNDGSPRSFNNGIFGRAKIVCIKPVAPGGTAKGHLLPVVFGKYLEKLFLFTTSLRFGNEKSQNACAERCASGTNIKSGL